MSTWGADRILDLASAALDLDGADGVEVVVSRSEHALTRFAESRIHQNVARTDGEVRVRVVTGGARVGVAVGNELTAAGVRTLAAAALEAAKLTPPDAEFAGFAAPSAYQPAGVFDEATAGATPTDRAAIVRTLIDPLGAGMVAAGAAETASGEFAVVNSLGVRAYHPSTLATVSVLVSGDDSSGYAENSAGRLSDVDAALLAARAVSKTDAGRRPVDVDPGDWAVILEPAAASTLVQWLGWIAFGGKAVREGRSPLSGRIGEHVCDPRVTIADDALSPALPGVPFDHEGVPKRRVDLIRDGVAAGVVHDLASARVDGVESTGHALPAPNPEGGLPLHLVMSPGTASTEQLVAGCERGLLVTRFHYTNLVHPLESVITGMTRDGTFLVEDGEVRRGVRNLRFTQSILAALSAVEEIGAETELATELFFGASRAPALRLSRFHFSSTTTF